MPPPAVATDAQKNIVSIIENYLSEPNWTSKNLPSKVGYEGWIEMKHITPLLTMMPKKDLEPRIRDAFKAVRSSDVALHWYHPLLRRIPDLQKVKKVLEDLFFEPSFIKNLRLQLLLDASGFVRVSELLGMKEFQALRIPADALSCFVASALDGDHSFEVRDLGSESVAIRRKTLRERLVAQVEYYFSDANLKKDVYMTQKMLDREDMWIPLQEILEFQKIKNMCYPDMEAAARCLEHSKVVELRSDRNIIFIRPVNFQDYLPIPTEDDEPLDQDPPLSPMLPWIPSKASYDFTLMSYNILANHLATNAAFRYADQQHLRWSYRQKLLLGEIMRVHPSILCLQEVQTTSDTSPHNHARLFSMELRKYGYVDLYTPKSGAKEGFPTLGVGIYYMAESFAQIEYRVIKFQDILGKLLENDPLSSSFYGLPHVALAVVLKDKETQKKLIVCVTHIACRFENPDIQTAQVMACLQALESLSAKHGNPPLIFCGDFNSTPASVPVSLIKHNSASVDLFDVVPANLNFPYQTLEHQLSLASAYEHVMHAEPDFSNLTADFAGCLDYIFFTPQSLNVASVLALPQEEACRAQVGLPNAEFPSDHLPLTASFSFL